MKFNVSTSRIGFLLLTALLMFGFASILHAEDNKYALENLLQDRVLGDENAPVEIIEFSSLSCPHCKSFHENAYKDIYEQYIKPGKVKLRFSDFPLNRAALNASMVARCVPEPVYFQFVEFLFETQQRWAFSEDPMPYLRQNSKLLGLNDDAFETCFNQEGYADAVIEAVRSKSQEYQIGSTPTFVFVESGAKISGAQSFANFKKVIDEHLSRFSLNEE